jgi:hypothetical protein
MSKRYPRAKWPLPNPVDPGEFTCLSLRIPNSREYRMAVRGALDQLAHAWAWEDDPLHFAKDVADFIRPYVTQLQFNDLCTGEVQRPNWALELAFNQGRWYEIAWDQPAAIVWADGSVGEVYTLVAWPTGSPISLSFDIIPFRRSDGNPVGGRIESTDFSAMTDAPGTITITEHSENSCAGESGTSTLPLPFSLGPSTYTSISVHADITGFPLGITAPIFVTLYTKGDYVCIP